jgi:hypothetical protein
MMILFEVAGHSMRISDKDINHFHQDKDDNDPFQGETVSVLQQIFE